MTDFRALCVELIESVLSDNSHIDCMDIARRARAALADEPAVPAPPADGDVAELPPRPLLMTPPVHPALERYGITWDGSPDKPLLTRMADGYWTPWHVAAELLQRLISPQPVPVSERLPGPEDCLDEGWAWFFSPRVGWRQAVFPVSTAYTHWLPAHALPIPHQQENAND